MKRPVIYLSTSRNDRRVGEYKVGSAFRDGSTPEEVGDCRRHDNYNADNSHNRPYTVAAIDLYTLTNCPECILDDPCPDPRITDENVILSYLRSFEKKLAHPAFECEYNRLNDKGSKDPEEIQSIHSEWFDLEIDLTDDDRDAQWKEAERKFLEILRRIIFGEDKPNVEMEYLQEKQLRRALKLVWEAVEQGQDIWRAINMFCPRFGKTIYYLMMFKYLHQLFGTKIMILPAYVLSVFTSFQKEIVTFIDFQDMRFVDGRDDDYEEQIKRHLANNKLVVFGMSLHIKNDQGVEEDCESVLIEKLNKKFRYIRDMDNASKFVLADEADFGSYVKRCRNIIAYIINE